MKKRKMSKKILILHGWNASPSQHFFPKAKEKFLKEGYQIEIPPMPGNYFPKLENWLKTIKSYRPDKDWILIGHSLGGVAILKYLENAKAPIKQAILLATPFDSMKFGAIENFYDEGFDWKKIRANCPKFNLVYETDDPVVPKEHGQKYTQELTGNLKIIAGGMHLHNLDLDFLEGLFI